MPSLDLDLTNLENPSVDINYINKQIESVNHTSVHRITSIICSLAQNGDKNLEKIILILVLSKIMSIVFTIENSYKENECPIDTLLKRYKTNSSVRLEESEGLLQFTKYVKNNKIVIGIEYAYTRFYASGTDQDFEYNLKINYKIIEWFEVVMSINIENLKRIINNTIKARIEWERTREDRERQWKKSIKDHGMNLNDPETHFELFGEYPD